MISVSTLPGLLAQGPDPLSMIVKTIMWVVVAFAVVVGLIMFFLFIRYFNLWLRGYVTRAESVHST